MYDLQLIGILIGSNSVPCSNPLSDSNESSLWLSGIAELLRAIFCTRR